VPLVCKYLLSELINLGYTINSISILFSYKKHKYLGIRNITNSLDGGVFSPMKMLIKIHRGLSKSLKLKMVDDYLVKDKK